MKISSTGVSGEIVDIPALTCSGFLYFHYKAFMVGIVERD